MRWGSTFVLAICLVGCPTPVQPGAACTRASDCSAPLVCSYGRCRVECVSTRDCPPAARCIASAGIGVCTLDTENHCDTAVCPSPLRCVADQCRTGCTSDTECLDGTCVSGTCVEPVSGADAGPAGDDAGTDAAMPDAGLPGTCTPVPAPTLLALGLGGPPPGIGMQAATAQVIETDATRPPVLALSAHPRPTSGPRIELGTTNAGAPVVFTAPADALPVFGSHALYPSVTDAYALDFATSGDDFLAMVMRQAASESDPFGWGHDDSFETDLQIASLVPGRPLLADETFHGATAIVGGQSAFGSTAVSVFHVFHTHSTPNGGEMGAADRTRSASTWHPVPSLSAAYQSDVLEMASGHGPLLVVRDPTSGHVAYWHPEVTPAPGLVELATNATTLPGVATSLDGADTLVALAHGSDVELTRVHCTPSACDAPVGRGYVAAGAPVAAVAMTELARGLVLAVARDDGSVELLRLDDTGTEAIASPFADVPGASGSRFVAPMPFAGTAAVVRLRVAATPVPGGAAQLVVAVLTESGAARRLWTGALATCAL